MKRFCLALDLIENPASIEEYERWHKSENTWPEIKKSITDSGITNMEIYRTGNRLFMIMETTDDFSFERKTGDGRSKSQSTAMGRINVEVSTAIALGKARRKMDSDG